MSTREQLAEVIRDGEGTWRTPFEAADAILGALAPQSAALDAVLATLDAWSLALNEDRGLVSPSVASYGDRLLANIRAAVNNALEADE